MAWTDDLVVMTRILINDHAAPQKHSDAYLQRVLVCAGILVRKDIELAYDYVFDLTATTISPDPMANGDGVMQALLPLKAACIINIGQYQTAIGQSIRVKDGDSSIDTSVGFAGYRDILKFGPCAAYERLRWQLQASSAAAVGAVMGAFRCPNDNVIDSIAYFYDEFATQVARSARRIR